MKESNKEIVERAGSLEELATLVCGYGHYTYHNDNRAYPIPKDAIKEYLEMGAYFAKQQIKKVT